MIRQMIRRGFVAAGAVAMTASLAVAQGPRQVPPDPQTVPELKAEFDRAVKLGVPTSPLVEKAREGYVKQASPKMIREALHGLTDRMVRAQAALQPVHSVGEVTAGAFALSIDIPERVLRNLRKEQKTRSIEVPLAVLANLVSRGVPLQQAAAQVNSLMSRNATESQMIALASLVESDIASGLAPSTALDVRSRGVLSATQGSLPGAAAAQSTGRSSH